MAKVYCNCSLKNGEKKELKNGATKRTLCLVNKSGIDIEYNVPFNADLGFLNKGNHSFVFINPPKKMDDRVLFIIMNGGYGLHFHGGTPLFYEISEGGYGNSKSSLAVLSVGTIVEYETYKNRHTPSFDELTETGIFEIAAEDAYLMLGEEVEEI